MKTIIFFLVVAVMTGVLVWQYHTQYLALEEHKLQMQEASVSQSLVAQQRCTEQAHDRFRRLGWENGKSAKFRNHYNAKLDKCFVLIENSTTSLDIAWDHATLSDAGDGTILGNYAWRSISGEKPSDVAPYTCDVTLPSSEKTACKSDAEFKSLINVYMK